MHTFAQKPKAARQTLPVQPASSLLRLQRSGNQTVHRILHVQTKLTVGSPGDVFEQEADRVSEQITSRSEPRVQRACSCGGECPDCQNGLLDQIKVRLKTAPAGAGTPEQGPAPPIVDEVLSRPGQPLDAVTRGQIEQHFGQDFSGVRIHTDELAARSAESVGAQAYTVGSAIVFGAGRYAPASREGLRLLAHELTHVVQQDGAGAPRSLQRFHLPHGTGAGRHEDDETSQIAADFNDMLAAIQALIASSTHGGWPQTVNMEAFISKVGGAPFTKDLDKKLGTRSTPKRGAFINPRYLFTCRCGLIDMLHFLQLLYLSNFVAATGPGVDANRVATRKGREHELAPGASASESRFGPEDTTSNALGAFTATGLAAYPRPGPLFDAIKDTLSRCSPIGFKSLSAASQEAIRHFYGDLVPDPTKPGDLIPKHQNTTAVPAVLQIPECGGAERSFPFSLDSDDSDRKTISDTAFAQGSTGLKKGRDFREFIATQRPEVLKALPTSEKIRMLKVLLGGTVSNDDLEAAGRLTAAMTPAERAVWDRQLPLPTDD